MTKSLRMAFLAALLMTVMAITAYSALAASGPGMSGQRGGLAALLRADDLKAAAQAAPASDAGALHVPARTNHLPGCDESEYEVDDG